MSKAAHLSFTITENNKTRSLFVDLSSDGIISASNLGNNIHDVKELYEYISRFPLLICPEIFEDKQ